MAENGYTATSIAQILKRAGVSRETFYEQFRSKEDCFEAGFTWAVTLVRDRVRGAAPDEENPTGREEILEQLDRLLAAYLQDLADDPARARTYLVEVYAAGPRFAAMRAASHTAFVDRLAALFRAETEAQRFACQMFVAATSTMVTLRAASGDFDGILALRAPILEMITRSGDMYGTALVTD